MAGGRRLAFSFASELPEVYFFCFFCLSVWLSVLAVSIYQHSADPGLMGQCRPSPTPLSLITDHFKKVKLRAHGLSVGIKRESYALSAVQNGRPPM